jgi:16S rRNA C967 or C1407 C5-methylase (RsmB/RsmF family)
MLAAGTPGSSDALAPLERYRPLVDDFDALRGACARPLPRVIWANPLRADPNRIAERVAANLPDAVPIGWATHAWRLPPTARVGTLAEYRLGLVHGQEEAALWAAPLLGAQPGERVLDLCAAPGNKTAQLAVAMRDNGMLVANERNWKRLDSLRHNLERLGITCAAVMCGDGLRLRWQGELFDRVLADVPCSCEGTIRKTGAPRENDGVIADSFRTALVSVQVGLLRRALASTRPGGTVLYSTCTFAPEENEGVLDAIDPALACVEPLDVPKGLHTTPGITRWGESTYRADAVHAARVWPHHNDTGGFFVARLRRL